MYTVGMEEEYFVFDAKTRRAVRRLDKKFLSLTRKKLGDRVMTEMLQSQIERQWARSARVFGSRPEPGRISLRYSAIASVSQTLMPSWVRHGALF